VPSGPLGFPYPELTKRCLMPSLEENESNWNAAYDWTLRGDEWSSHWGGVETHWHATLLPRVWPFLPTGTICEIAPGYGRWTQYLLPQCDQYVGVDLASRCVDACRQRFSSFDHARFEVNDGRSLAVLENDSVDFVFSFDSLVHVLVAPLEPWRAQPPGPQDGASRGRGLPVLDPTILAAQVWCDRVAPRASQINDRSSFCRPGKPGSAQVCWTGNCELGQPTPYRLHLFGYAPGFGMGPAKRSAAKSQLHGRRQLRTEHRGGLYVNGRPAQNSLIGPPSSIV
jgi:hypothetical protein